MENNNAKSRRKFLNQATSLIGGFMIVPRFVLGGKNALGHSYLPPSDKVNLGFIGAGKQARILANFFMQTGEININAVCDAYKDKIEVTKKKVSEFHTKYAIQGAQPNIKEYGDFRELLSNKDVDAVVISTPDHLHGVMSVLASKAGKDVYCEKPLALTVEEGRQMVKAARKYKSVFQTGSMQRSWPEFRQAAELVRNGYIGEVIHIRVNVGAPPVKYNLPEQPVPEGLDWNMWLGPNAYVPFNAELAPPITKDVYPDWRKFKEFGGGDVTDWGAHMFDIVQWALDMDHSGPLSFTPPNGTDIKYLTMKYESGITMTHETWDWKNAINFIGTEGEIKVQRKKIETSKPELATKLIGPNEKHVYFSDNHYKDFLKAMRNRTKPICDVEIGHRTSSLCNVANIAYELKRPLTWNPKKEKFTGDNEANKLLGRSMKKEWKIKV